MGLPQRAVMAALLLCASSAAAQKASERPNVRLTYERRAGASACPDVPAMRDAIRARLGYDPFHEPASITLEALIEGDADGLRAQVRRSTANGAAAARELRSPGGDCAELASSVQLAISIAIDPLSLAAPAQPPQVLVVPPPITHPEPTPLVVPPPPAPPPLPAPRPTLEASAGVLGAYGASPGWTGGMTLGGALRWPRFSLGLEGRAHLAQDLEAGGGSVESSTLFAALAPCYRHQGFGACALFAAGAMRGAGRGLEGARSVSTPWVAAGARLQQQLPATGRLGARVFVDLLAPMTRTTLLVGKDEAFETPPLSAAAGLQLVGGL